MLILIYFSSPWLGHTVKADCIEFQTADQAICPILFLRKGPGTSFSTAYCVLLFKKNIPYVMLLADEIYRLIAFTSSDIEQYLYCNYFFSRKLFFYAKNFEINRSFLNMPKYILINI